MELAKKIDDLGSTVEEFKKAHAKELAEVKEFGKASAETKAQVEKINGKISDIEASITEIKAAVTRANLADNVDNVKSLDAKKAAEYGEALSGYMRKGRDIPTELQAFAVQQITGRKDLSVDSDTDGGFLVSPEVSSEIVKKVFETSPMRDLASVQTISSDMLEIMEDLDEVDAEWVGERQPRTVGTTPKLNMIKIPVHEISAKPQATQKLLDDAAINIEQWLQGKVADKFARKENTAFISGDGVAMPMGILSYAQGNGFNMIERITAAGASALTADDLINLQTALKEPYQAGATFALSRQVLGEVRKLKDGQGRYIWVPGLTDGKISTLLGQPVRMFADLPTTIATGQSSVLYGDFKQGYQIVDRVGIRVLRDPYTAKPFVMFYTTKRVGGGVKNFEAIKVLKQA